MMKVPTINCPFCKSELILQRISRINYNQFRKFCIFCKHIVVNKTAYSIYLENGEPYKLYYIVGNYEIVRELRNLKDNYRIYTLPEFIPIFNFSKDNETTFFNFEDPISVLNKIEMLLAFS